MIKMRYIILVSVFFSYALYAQMNPLVFGGEKVDENDPVAKSSVGFVSSTDFDTGYGLIDGSGTLIAPDIAIGAAHTCVKFTPFYVVFGPAVPTEFEYDYEDIENHPERFPMLKTVVDCVAHPNYPPSPSLETEEDYKTRQSYDIAIFYLSETPVGIVPAKVAHPDSALPRDITIAGFGAYEGQFDYEIDPETGEGITIRPYSLRKVDSFISEEWPDGKHFKDGPNPGISSCQGDSGGSIYAKTDMLNTPVLIGMPLAGPACPDGIGYDNDIRYYVDWIEATTGVELETVILNDDSSCGNGVIENFEQCDTENLNNTNCEDLGFDGGELTCQNNCLFDTSICYTIESDGDSLEYFDEDVVETPETTVDSIIAPDEDIDSEEALPDDDTFISFPDETKDEIVEDDMAMVDETETRDEDLNMQTDISATNDNEQSETTPQLDQYNQPDTSETEDNDLIEITENDAGGCSCSIVMF